MPATKPIAGAGLLVGLAALLLVPAVRAYPPAPPHTIYGVVRDTYGNPYEQPTIAVVLYGSDNAERARTTIDPLVGLGLNYSLEVPMDAGTTTTLYEPTAMRPTLPFTMRVVIAGASYLPLQLSTGTWVMGNPAERRRIDLTVGVDSDGDGIPDAWEWELIYSDPSGRLANLADVRPGDDADGDGLSNFAEYIAGTYAFDAADGFALEILGLANGFARLQFLAVKGRSYSISSSTDLTTWTTQTFALTSGGAAGASYTATDTRVLDVYAPLGAGGRRFFRLHVQ